MSAWSYFVTVLTGEVVVRDTRISNSADIRDIEAQLSQEQGRPVVIASVVPLHTPHDGGTPC